jgi:hypothetical protein
MKRPKQASSALQWGGGRYEQTEVKLFIPVKAESALRKLKYITQ